MHHCRKSINPDEEHYREVEHQPHHILLFSFQSMGISHLVQGLAFNSLFLIPCSLFLVSSRKVLVFQRVKLGHRCSRICRITSSCDDYTISPLPRSYLEKTSLGKISRTKIKTAFKDGEYWDFDHENKQRLDQQRALTWRRPDSSTEDSVVNILSKLLETPSSSIDVNLSIFELGITSFNLIAMKQQIQDDFALERDLSLGTLLKSPTIRGISPALGAERSKCREYDPVVPLQTQGGKAPLWCGYPGSGDILVFVQLAQQFANRSAYALRTRGYNPGEQFFSGPQEAADTHCKHIKMTQRDEPYAIVGYSLGSTLAYEIAKRLRAQGDEVRFLASMIPAFYQRLRRPSELDGRLCFMFHSSSSSSTRRPWSISHMTCIKSPVRKLWTTSSKSPTRNA